MSDLPLSHSIRRRFVKDFGLPIQVLQDPHWDYMLDLFEPFYGSRTKLSLLHDEIRDCGSEEAFLTRVAGVQAAAVEALQSSQGYWRLGSDRLERYGLGPSRFAEDPLYQPQNDGRAIISVDLVKSNYQALRYHDPDLVLGIPSYDDFLRRFTDRPYLLHSKQFRQVILSKVHPQKQQRIQKWIMRQLMDKVSDLRGTGTGVREVSVDEFCVLTADTADFEGFVVVTDHNHLEADLSAIREALAAVPFECRVTPFRLHQLPDTPFYVKVYFDGRLPEPKCVPSFYMPQVLRHLSDQPITLDDLLFFHNDGVARYLRPVLQGYREAGGVWRRAA